MKKHFYCSFLFLFLLLPNLCRSMSEDDKGTLDDEITLVERTIDACDTDLRQMHQVMCGPLRKFELGLLCLVISYFFDYGGSFSQFFFWQGIYLLLDSSWLNIANYYDNFTDKEKGARPINYKQARMRLCHGIKSSFLFAVSAYILFDYGESLHDMLMEGDKAPGELPEGGDFPGFVPAIWSVSLGFAVYNLDQLMKNICGKKIVTHHSFVSNISEGVLLWFLLPIAKRAILPAICKEKIENFLALNGSFETAEKAAVQQLAEELTGCIQIYRIRGIPFNILDAYGLHLVWTEIIRISKDKVSFLNAHLKMKRAVVQSWSMAVKEVRQSRLDLNEEYIPNDLERLPIRVDTHIDKEEHMPPLALKAHANVCGQPRVRMGNIKAPPKPKKHKTNTKDTSGAPLSQRDEVHYQTRFELIEETFELARLTQISEEKIFHMAARVAKVLKNGEFKPGPKASIKWQGADGNTKRACFNGISGRRSNLKVAALKAILVALILDLTNEEINLLERDLLESNAKACTSWRDALELFHRNKCSS